MITELSVGVIDRIVESRLQKGECLMLSTKQYIQKVRKLRRLRRMGILNAYWYRQNRLAELVMCERAMHIYLRLERLKNEPSIC